jgi:hypothetical protein
MNVPQGAMNDETLVCSGSISCHPCRMTSLTRTHAVTGAINTNFYRKTLLPPASFSSANSVNATDNAPAAGKSLLLCQVGVQASHTCVASCCTTCCLVDMFLASLDITTPCCLSSTKLPVCLAQVELPAGSKLEDAARHDAVHLRVL